MTDVVRKVILYKNYLESTEETSKILLVLQKLSELAVTTEILQSTGIGKIINGLRKQGGTVAEFSRKLVTKWKNLVTKYVHDEKVKAETLVKEEKDRDDRAKEAAKRPIKILDLTAEVGVPVYVTPDKKKDNFINDNSSDDSEYDGDEIKGGERVSDGGDVGDSSEGGAGSSDAEGGDNTRDNDGKAKVKHKGRHKVVRSKGRVREKPDRSLNDFIAELNSDSGGNQKKKKTVRKIDSGSEDNGESNDRGGGSKETTRKNASHDISDDSDDDEREVKPSYVSPFILKDELKKRKNAASMVDKSRFYHQLGGVVTRVVKKEPEDPKLIKKRKKIAAYIHKDDDLFSECVLLSRKNDPDAPRQASERVKPAVSGHNKAKTTGESVKRPEVKDGELKLNNKSNETKESNMVSVRDGTQQNIDENETLLLNKSNADVDTDKRKSENNSLSVENSPDLNRRSRESTPRSTNQVPESPVRRDSSRQSSPKPKHSPDDIRPSANEEFKKVEQYSNSEEEVEPDYDTGRKREPRKELSERDMAKNAGQSENSDGGDGFLKLVKSNQSSEHRSNKQASVSPEAEKSLKHLSERERSVSPKKSKKQKTKRRKSGERSRLRKRSRKSGKKSRDNRKGNDSEDSLSADDEDATTTKRRSIKRSRSGSRSASVGSSRSKSTKRSRKFSGRNRSDRSVSGGSGDDVRSRSDRRKNDGERSKGDSREGRSARNKHHKAKSKVKHKKKAKHKSRSRSRSRSRPRANNSRGSSNSRNPFHRSRSRSGSTLRGKSRSGSASRSKNPQRNLPRADKSGSRSRSVKIEEIRPRSKDRFSDEQTNRTMSNRTSGSPSRNKTRKSVSKVSPGGGSDELPRREKHRSRGGRSNSPPEVVDRCNDEIKYTGHENLERGKGTRASNNLSDGENRGAARAEAGRDGSGSEKGNLSKRHSGADETGGELGRERAEEHESKRCLLAQESSSRLGGDSRESRRHGERVKVENSTNKKSLKLDFSKIKLSSRGKSPDSHLSTPDYMDYGSGKSVKSERKTADKTNVPREIGFKGNVKESETVRQIAEVVDQGRRIMGRADDSKGANNTETNFARDFFNDRYEISDFLTEWEGTGERRIEARDHARHVKHAKPSGGERKNEMSNRPRGAPPDDRRHMIAKPRDHHVEVDTRKNNRPFGLSEGRTQPSHLIQKPKDYRDGLDSRNTDRSTSLSEENRKPNHSSNQSAVADGHNAALDDTSNHKSAHSRHKQKHLHHDSDSRAESSAKRESNSSSFDETRNRELGVDSRDRSRDKAGSRSSHERRDRTEAAGDSQNKYESPGNFKFPSPPQLKITHDDILGYLPVPSANYRPWRYNAVDTEMKPTSSHSGILLNDKTEPEIMDDRCFAKKSISRTMVYSGKRTTGLTEMMSLYDQCLRCLMDNIDCLDYVGGVPYYIMKPVLERCTAEQLCRLEESNTHFITDSDELWKKHCLRDFKNKPRGEGETYRDVYLRSFEERESKLQSLKSEIAAANEARQAPVRTTKMAFMDGMAKPPHQVLKQQMRYGTATIARPSPGRVNVAGYQRPRPSLLSAAPSDNNYKSVRSAGPMMKKTLKMMKSMRR